ncbi:MAG: hypothetical protein O3A10_12025 [Chloroflexi bacterium]|nr:hypothetical protein [Chloroflexota bacterium]MDA1147102.1 hypothetical protein [Chloroflexota bacterium]
MTATLPADILARVERDLPADRQTEVIAALEGLASATREHARIARCVLFVANGNLAEFERMVKLARTDSRDAIMSAEYSRNERRLRDFSRPFGSNALT